MCPIFFLLIVMKTLSIALQVLTAGICDRPSTARIGTSYLCIQDTILGYKGTIILCLTLTRQYSRVQYNRVE